MAFGLGRGIHHSQSFLHLKRFDPRDAGIPPFRTDLLDDAQVRSCGGVAQFPFEIALIARASFFDLKQPFVFNEPIENSVEGWLQAQHAR
ncbi:hypothetical protein [Edaphobacter aggregans]|uniref:hypothetical protein n=1 Tax=Edaphobacter aggregans TaxID=570835 RepID=UPI0012F7F1DE|nr:hypothetical protein [Edaphobacter aggregans]